MYMIIFNLVGRDLADLSQLTNLEYVVRDWKIVLICSVSTLGSDTFAILGERLRNRDRPWRDESIDTQYRCVRGLVLVLITVGLDFNVHTRIVSAFKSMPGTNATG
jgi:hypothetical protein